MSDSQFPNEWLERRHRSVTLTGRTESSNSTSSHSQSFQMTDHYDRPNNPVPWIGSSRSVGYRRRGSESQQPILPYQSAPRHLVNTQTRVVAHAHMAPLNRVSTRQTVPNNSPRDNSVASTSQRQDTARENFQERRYNEERVIRVGKRPLPVCLPGKSCLRRPGGKRAKTYRGKVRFGIEPQLKVYYLDDKEPRGTERPTAQASRLYDKSCQSHNPSVVRFYQSFQQEEEDYLSGRTGSSEQRHSGAAAVSVVDEPEHSHQSSTHNRGSIPSISSGRDSRMFVTNHMSENDSSSPGLTSPESPTRQDMSKTPNSVTAKMVLSKLMKPKMSNHKSSPVDNKREPPSNDTPVSSYDDENDRDKGESANGEGLENQKDAQMKLEKQKEDMKFETSLNAEDVCSQDSTDPLHDFDPCSKDTDTSSNDGSNNENFTTSLAKIAKTPHLPVLTTTSTSTSDLQKANATVVVEKYMQTYLSTAEKSTSTTDLSIAEADDVNTPTFIEIMPRKQRLFRRFKNSITSVLHNAMRCIRRKNGG